MKLIVDLSHTIREGMPVYPGTPEPRINSICTHIAEGFAELELKLNTHTGTHIDAPFHILKNAKTLSELEPDKFIGSALVITCFEIEEDIIDKVKSAIDKYGCPDFVLIYTGWSAKWGKSDYFGLFPLPDFQSFEYLATLPLKGVGIDAISLDKVSADILINHNTILGKGFIIIENLTNLDQIPEGLFEFFCFPLKIEKADGSPVRAIAKISD